MMGQSYDFGGIAIDNHNNPLPDETLEAARGADAILLGVLYSMLIYHKGFL
jgi:3-isopropylmalate dehydrogenase